MASAAYQILVGDVFDRLRELPDESVHCVVTSPPFWGLRDYGVVGQIGLEATPEEYIAKMVAVFREVRRILRFDGCCFVNLGDAYNAAGRNGHGTRIGYKQATNRASAEGVDTNRPTAPLLKPKDLVGIPWRFALAAQADGWYLRSAMPWVKRSALPESCRDRPASALEYIFLLTKSSHYYFDMEAVRQPSPPSSSGGPAFGKVTRDGPGARRISQEENEHIRSGGRNFRNSDLWYQSVAPDSGKPYGLVGVGDELVGLDVTPQPYKSAHFATFPEQLVQPLILAGTSDKGCCPECGAPWLRIVERTKYEPVVVPEGERFVDASRGDKTRKLSGAEYNEQVKSRTLGWRPSCRCGGSGKKTKAMKPIPCTVLDPFLGSGTTLQVARCLGRRGIGIELNPEYAKMAERRIRQPLGYHGERNNTSNTGQKTLFNE